MVPGDAVWERGTVSDLTAFALAVLAFLATPGPTNTLLAASGAAQGIRASLRLVPAEIAGYMISISTLAGVIGPWLGNHSGLALGLKLAACLWLTVSAARLWRDAAHADLSARPAGVSVGRVFVTTLLNPKALIFALVLLPPRPLMELGPWLALLAGLIVAVALGWIALETILAKSAGDKANPGRIWRLAAVVLCLFSTLLVGSAVASIY